jgi:hypothetical protein
MPRFSEQTIAAFRSFLRIGKQMDAEKRDAAAHPGAAKPAAQHHKKKAKRPYTMLRRIAENPIMNITAGFLLMATALLEVLEPIWGTSSGIKSEHGAAIFGFLQFMKWLPDGFKGLKFVEEGDDDAPAHLFATK